MSARHLRCHNTPAMDCVPAVAAECNLTRLRTKPYIDVNCEKIHFLRVIIVALIKNKKWDNNVKKLQLLRSQVKKLKVLHICVTSL